MPHVLIEGTIDLSALVDRLSPQTERVADVVRRTRNTFFNRLESTILIETKTVEAGITRNFFVRVDRKRGGAMVRIEPMTAVDRTTGVIETVAWVAENVRAQIPDGRLGTTNIPPGAFPASATDTTEAEAGE